MMLRAALCVLMLLAVAKPTLAGQAEDIARIEGYLNRLTTVVADFSQVSPDGKMTEGKFYLKRPGKMRWQYSPPTPILMVASGSEIIFYDYGLEQVTHIPLDSTMAGFIAKPNISLKDPSLELVDFENAAGVIRLTLRQKKAPENGTLTLEFADKPLQIRNFIVTDSQDQTTTVSLNNASFGTPLDNSLFVFKDPRKKPRN